MSNNIFNEFIRAVKSKNLKTIEKTFHPEYLNQADNDGYFPIHLACLNNLEEIFKYFLKQNCNIELCDAHNCRPIHCAILGGAVEIIKLLIGHRCEMECKTDKGETLLDLANQLRENRNEIIEIIEMTKANREIGIKMDLKCRFDCDHEFCLTSFCLNEFLQDDIISIGPSGKVFRVSESQSQGNREFAVKKVTWRQLDSTNTDPSKNILNSITNDAKYLEKNINEYRRILLHEHIVQYFGAITQDYKMFIFMEYVAGGSIYNKLQTDDCKDGLPHNLIIKYSQHVLKGLDFLHKQKIIHRDIKTANILLDRNDNCKLTDFGLSRLLETISKHNTNSKNQKPKKNENEKKKNAIAKTFCGTANYMAPEIINGEAYSYPCDLWSLGATIIEMLTGKPPHSNISQNLIILRIGKEKKIEYKASNPPSAEMKKFIDQLLKPLPKDRESAEELLKSNLFKNF